MPGINTNTLLLIGAGAAVLYFVTRPAVPTLPIGYNQYGQPITTTSPVYNPYAPLGQDPLAQQIAAGGSVLKGLGDVLGNFFGDD